MQIISKCILVSALAILQVLAPNHITSAQVKSIGLPYVQNFSKSEYNADTQNWEITEGNNGMIYAANNQGLLQFDGLEWSLFPVSNGSIVRSLAIGNDNHIYVGAYNELGRFVKTSRGSLKYESLLEKIPEEYRDFDDVWKTYNTRYGIVFQSYEYLFIFKNEYFRVIAPENRFGFSFYINNNLYIVEKGEGLKTLNTNGLDLISDDVLFSENEIRFILPHLSNELLIGTLSRGFYILQKNSVRKWNTESNILLLENKIFSGIKIKDQYAVGSIKNGIYFIDEAGNVKQHLNRRKGLQNNTILSLFKDQNNNIWLGLDNGIDYIKTSLPVSILNYNYNLEATYASVVHNDMLYVGTNQGLFAKEMKDIANMEFLDFEMVENTEGQVWNLSVIDGNLFCGHTNGAYIINGMKSQLLYNKMGVWNFIQPATQENIILSGTYDGIIKFRKNESNQWAYETKLKGVNISVKDLIQDRNGNFWISHGYKGVYKLNLNNNFNEAIDFTQYADGSGLPSRLPYFTHQIDNILFFSTHQGIYQYNHLQDNFLRPKNLNDFYEHLGLIYKLIKDSQGNIWYFTENSMGVFKLLEDGSYVRIETPFKHLQNSLMASFSNINIYDRENIFIGTEDGLVHYDPNIIKNYLYDISPIIKQVYISDSFKDSLWFEKGSAQNSEPAGMDLYTLPFDYNNLRFKYTSNDMENTGNAEFRIRLIGFSKAWSGWTNSYDKEYTKLREGVYRFEVQTRNIYGKESNIAGFDFEIKPPFYRSTLAYLIYILSSVLLMIYIILWVIKRIEKARIAEKKKQESKYKQKTQKLQEDNILAEEELIRLRNEQLRVSMRHKNKELANATYHILQKNKFLNKLKTDLSGLSNKAKSEIVELELKKISRKIDRDIHHEQNWKVFNKYFDEVHQEFITRLKEKYPQLTPNDLRLCGYLRMNISTKEIAPLLNISIRGVEISRYRLRKKLNLDREENLIEYLLTF